MLRQHAPRIILNLAEGHRLEANGLKAEREAAYAAEQVEVIH